MLRSFASLLGLFLLLHACTAQSPVQSELGHPSADAKRVLIIGDSISLGQGALGASVNCILGPPSNSVEASFGSKVAVALQANLELWAWSGHGLTRNYNDFESTTIERRVASKLDQLPALDPHLILVHVGTNDFHEYDATGNFVPSYLDLLSKTSSTYPDAEIIALTGPMLAAADLRKLQNAVDNAVDSFNAKTSERRARVIHFSEELTSNYRFGCQWHPSEAMHQAMADRILGTYLNDNSNK